MLVYRVEDEEGKGPYNSYRPLESAESFKIIFGGENKTSHPLPEEDGLGSPVRGKDFFAFENLTQLDKWFGREKRRALGKCGFAITVYECPDHKVRKGSFQVIFEREYSVPVRKMSI